MVSFPVAVIKYSSGTYRRKNLFQLMVQLAITVEKSQKPELGVKVHPQSKGRATKTCQCWLPFHDGYCLELVQEMAPPTVGRFSLV